MDKGHQ